MSYALSGATSSRQLANLTCSCAFHTNYALPCQHQFHLLTALQFKSMACFEQLARFREYVGYKSHNTNDKRKTDSYKVRKETRLKSFIEKLSRKHVDDIKKQAKREGI